MVYTQMLNKTIICAWQCHAVVRLLLIILYNFPARYKTRWRYWLGNVIRDNRYTHYFQISMCIQNMYLQESTIDAKTNHSILGYLIKTKLFCIFIQLKPTPTLMTFEMSKNEAGKIVITAWTKKTVFAFKTSSSCVHIKAIFVLRNKNRFLFFFFQVHPHLLLPKARFTWMKHF